MEEHSSFNRQEIERGLRNLNFADLQGFLAYISQLNDIEMQQYAARVESQFPFGSVEQKLVAGQLGYQNALRDNGQAGGTPAA